MEIKLYIFGRCYSLCFGHETPWFEQVYCFSIVEESFEKDKTVSYARVVFAW